MCSYLQVFFCCVKQILDPSFDLHSLLSFSLFFLCLYLEFCCLDRRVWDWEVGYNWCQFLLCLSLKLPYGSSNPSNLFFSLCIMSLCVQLCVCICVCFVPVGVKGWHEMSSLFSPFWVRGPGSYQLGQTDQWALSNLHVGDPILGPHVCTASMFV